MALVAKNLPAKAGPQKRGRFHPQLGRFPCSLKQQSTPVFLPGKFHGQRTLVGYSPWGRKELDATEHSPVGLESEECLSQFETDIWLHARCTLDMPSFSSMMLHFD